MNKSEQIGSVPGYLAKPNGVGPWPSLVVIQEWWGLTDHIKSGRGSFRVGGLFGVCA